MSLLDEDWNYDSKPNEIPRDQVRELVGDTDRNVKLVSDTSVELALTLSGSNEQVAAAEIAKKIGARFAKEATSKSGKDYARTMDRSKAFFELAAMLRANDPSAVGEAWQIRCGTSQRLYGDGDIRRGAFRVGMFHTREHDPRTEVRDQDLLDDVRKFDELI
jgi:hypothetical protein